MTPGGRYCKPDCQLFHRYLAPYESWIHGFCAFDLARQDRVAYPDGTGGTHCCLPEKVWEMIMLPRR